ncbi:MAG: hypothetical protein KDC84_02710 [Crocinitomicaceae bacterium]|nr:hypothetical protein [Crocinitomicaceae bacterium]
MKQYVLQILYQSHLSNCKSLSTKDILSKLIDKYGSPLDKPLYYSVFLELIDQGLVNEISSNSDSYLTFTISKKGIDQYLQNSNTDFIG